MRRSRLAAALLGLALLAPLAPAATGDIAEARRLLAEAEAALRRAESAEARLAAIGTAIGAEEAALTALRRALRALAVEEDAIRRRIDGEEERLGEVLTALQSLSATPRSALLVYPGGPLDAARAAMLLSDALPVLEERMARLGARLRRLAEIGTARAEAEAEARGALAQLEALRAEGLQVLGSRHRPRSARLDASARAAADGAENLGALAAALEGTGGPRLGFADARGRLPLPVSGEVVAEFGVAGGGEAGEPASGWTIDAPAYAEVRAPWDGTVRFAGPLADYGNVMVLEPENGYLIVIAGLARVDREVGEVVLAGERLGDLGGSLPSSEEFLLEAASDDDLIGRERLYLELRKDGDPVDPAAWFQARGM